MRLTSFGIGLCEMLVIVYTAGWMEPVVVRALLYVVQRRVWYDICMICISILRHIFFHLLASTKAIRCNRYSVLNIVTKPSVVAGTSGGCIATAKS